MTKAVYDDLEDDSDFDSGNGSDELDFDSEFSDTTLPPPWWRMPTSAVDDDNEAFDEDDE